MELAECKRAEYVIRAIGDEAVHGYTDNLQEAYGLAVWIAARTMLKEGSEIILRSIPDRKIECRISEDRLSAIVRWTTVESSGDAEIEM